MTALLAKKGRVRDATRGYLDSLSEAQLNRTLAKRPEVWLAKVRSTAIRGWLMWPVRRRTRLGRIF